MTTTKGFKIAKFNYNQEVNDVNSKTYATKEAATNAGNSWERDCTVHADIRKSRWFSIYEVN